LGLREHVRADRDAGQCERLLLGGPGHVRPSCRGDRRAGRIGGARTRPGDQLGSDQLAVFSMHAHAFSLATTNPRRMRILSSASSVRNAAPESAPATMYSGPDRSPLIRYSRLPTKNSGFPVGALVAVACTRAPRVQRTGTPKMRSGAPFPSRECSSNTGRPSETMLGEDSPSETTPVISRSRALKP